MSTTDKITAFIQENCLGDRDLVIDADTPLLELGVLDSLKMAMLLNYIRDALSTPIPPERLSAAHFRSPGTIAALIEEVEIRY
jgi:clorobiocin biosynthesis protein CloN5